MSLDRMQKARTGLILSEPFFGTLSMRLELLEDPKCKTTWTDGKTLGFNPEWAANAPMDTLEAAFAHQVATCAFGHHLRRNGRDAKAWNDASDHCVNHELRRAGFRLPDGALIAPEFDGMHAEAIYAALKDKEQEQQANQPQQPKAGGDQQGQGTAQSGQGSQPGGAGESATGRVDDATDGEGNAADDAEVAAQEADWKVAAAQAAQVARGCGKLTGGIEAQVDAFVNSKVDWREALQRYLKARAKDDYNWSRPNRRYLPGAYLPSLDSPRTGLLAIAVDCSRSVIARVTEFLSEIEEIRQTMRPEKIIVMVFDTQVRQTYTFEADEEINVPSIRAGGGTAFDDPARVLEQMDVTPEVLVFLTDLDASSFGVEPNYPVLWVSTRATGKAPFGEVITM